MIQRFEEITRKRTISIICGHCAKPRRRTLSVTHTVNPFNQNPDGSVRTHEQVVDCLRADLDALHRKTVLCTTCEKERKQP